MANVQRIVQAPPEQVFAVLADGTVHIRDVDPHWPQVGSRLHHKAGPWPLSLHDTSEVLAVVPNRSLTLRAGLWPLGAARVEVTLDPVGNGATRVCLGEEFEAGPLRTVRNKINDLVLHRRNIEALRRLADLAEREKSHS